MKFSWGLCQVRVSDDRFNYSASLMLLEFRSAYTNPSRSMRMPWMSFAYLLKCRKFGLMHESHHSHVDLMTLSSITSYWQVHMFQYSIHVPQLLMNINVIVVMVFSWRFCQVWVSNGRYNHRASLGSVGVPKCLRIRRGVCECPGLTPVAAGLLHQMPRTDQRILRTGTFNEHYFNVESRGDELLLIIRVKEVMPQDCAWTCSFYWKVKIFELNGVLKFERESGLIGSEAEPNSEVGVSYSADFFVARATTLWSWK